MKTGTLATLGLALSLSLLTACQTSSPAPTPPKPDGTSSGVDQIIGVSGDLAGLSLLTTDLGATEFKIQNKTAAPIKISIPAPRTANGQLKLNVGSALDLYTETIAANETTSIPYLAECPIDPGRYTQEFEIRIDSQVKKVGITVQCDDDSEEEYEILESTKVLEPEDEAQLLSFNELERVAVFAPGSSFAATLELGDVVVSDPIPNIAPDGLAFEVETISADRTRITFSDADLAEIFDEVDVDNEFDPDFDDIDLKSSTFMPGISVMEGSGDTLLNLSFDEVLLGDKNKKDPENYLTATGKLLVNKPKLVFKAQLNAPVVGSLNIEEVLKLSGQSLGVNATSEERLNAMFLSCGWCKKAVNAVGSVGSSAYNSATKIVNNTVDAVVSAGSGAVNIVKNLTEGVSFNTELYGEFSEQASLKIQGKANSKLTKKIMIGNVKFKPITLSLGGIPVTVTHQLNLYIDMQGEVTGEVNYSVEQSFSYKAGISYDSKNSPTVKKISEVTPTFTQEFQLYGNFDLDAKAVAEYEATLFGTFGAFANAKIGPKVSARTDGDELKLSGEICASGDAGTREFEFKLPVIKEGIKLEGTNVNLFGTCFARQDSSVKLPLVANLDYRVDGETKSTSGITTDTVPEIDYGPSIPFKLAVVNPAANTPYLYQWSLDGAPLAVGSAERTVNLPASEIGKEHTLTAVVSVGTDPNVSLRRVTKKLTFKLKNSAPKVDFTSPEPLRASIGETVTLEARVSDNNEQLDCAQVRWSANAPMYELVNQSAGMNGTCVVRMKFGEPGTVRVFAQVTDSQNITTTTNRPVNVRP